MKGLKRFLVQNLKKHYNKHTIMSQNHHRNILLLYLYSFFIKRPVVPVLVLYYLLHNLSFTQIGIIAAASAITSVLLEIHGGVFSDTYGKRKSLLIGSFLGLITITLFLIGDNFWYFLLASIIYGICFSFVSGTRESLLYDTLASIKKKSSFKKYFGRMVFYGHIFNAIVLLIIPFFYNINTKLPFLITWFFYIGAFISAYFMIEIKKHSKQWNYKKKLSSAIKNILNTKSVLFAIVIFTIIRSFIFATTEYVQPLLLISGLEIIYFGVVYFLMRALGGMAGEFTHRLEKYFSNKALLLTIISLLILSFFTFSYGLGISIIIAIILTRILESLSKVLIQDEITKNVKFENRTTILSVSSLSIELTATFLALLFGISADLFGVQGMFFYATILLIISILFAHIFSPR